MSLACPALYYKQPFCFTAEIDKIEIEEDEWYRSMPKADLSRRPAKPKTVDLDMSGTFKKLDID